MLLAVNNDELQLQHHGLENFLRDLVVHGTV